MEKFVIGAALVSASLFALASFFGPQEFGIEFNADEDRGAPAAAPAAVEAVSGGGVGQPSTRYAATRLVIEDAAAVLKIVPEDRTDIAVTIAGGSRLPAFQTRLDGDAVILDGGLERRIRGCSVLNGEGAVTIANLGRVAQAELPTINVRMPRAVAVSVSDAVSGDIGPSATADIANRGCGDLQIAPVAGALKLTAAGSGDMEAQTAQSLELRLSGSADVRAAAIAQDADVSISGSGDVDLGPVGGGLNVALAGSGGLEAQAVKGKLDVSIAGSGDVTVRGGRPSPVSIAIAGSGGVEIDGAVGELTASIMGSGDVRVDAVEGAIERTVVGSGEVRVGE